MSRTTVLELELASNQIPGIQQSFFNLFNIKLGLPDSIRLAYQQCKIATQTFAMFSATKHNITVRNLNSQLLETIHISANLPTGKVKDP